MACSVKFVLIVLATGFWYFSSSINAVASQKLFSGSKTGLQNRLDELDDNNNNNLQEQAATKGIISMAVILTVAQLVMGGIISLLLLFFVGGEPTTSLPQRQTPQQAPKPDSGMKRLEEFFGQIQKLDLVIGFLHCIGSICTNIGYGYGSASLVQVIKLLEPIETLLLTALMQQSLQALSFQKMTSTLTIIGGTYMLLSNPSIEVNPKSVFFAIGSGICMASRNVFSKKRQQKALALSKKQDVAAAANKNDAFRVILQKGMKKFATITITSACSAVCLGGLMALLHLPLFRLLVPQLLLFSPKSLNQTIIFHCLYNMASITVLSLTSATSHSLLNVGKRIANVTITSMAFGIPLTVAGRVGLVVAAIGACFNNDKIAAVLQSKARAKKFPSRRWLVGLAVSILVIAQLFYSTQMLNQSYSSSGGLVKSNSKNVTRSHHHKVVLLGPHERYNFGDLLFSSVVAKLLVSRGGYQANEILYGGLVSVSMEAYGGPKNVQSMKEIQSLSQKDEYPYDIIYTGGEALGCDFHSAVDMLPTPELKARARKDQVDGCAYLFAKRLLLPKRSSSNDNHNYAVINSLGGNFVARPCQEAVDTADYASYRDHNPLYPDSAVMTKELFSQRIKTFATKALEEIRLAADDKFVAVQHKTISTKGAAQELASALDDVARGLKAKVVFFAAGTAPDHDSFASYEQVVSFMQEEAIVFKGENVWKVVGLISRATAVYSTSLHVRIMAFIYFKPRVTWCKRGYTWTWAGGWGLRKYSKFIELWDTETSAQCLETKSDSWKVLEKHYFVNPDQAKAMTEAKYKEVVDKYLESFSKYSGMLRPRRTTNNA